MSVEFTIDHVSWDVLYEFSKDLKKVIDKIYNVENMDFNLKSVNENGIHVKVSAFYKYGLKEFNRTNTSYRIMKNYFVSEIAAVAKGYFVDGVTEIRTVN